MIHKHLRFLLLGYDHMRYDSFGVFFLIGLPVVGVGFTGTLASTHPKRGDHRCCSFSFL